MRPHAAQASPSRRLLFLSCEGHGVTDPAPNPAEDPTADLTLPTPDTAPSSDGQKPTVGDQDATIAHERGQASSADATDFYLRVTQSGERFRKLRLHAQGGLGEVSVALDQQLNREVALKELQERHADDPAKQQRFVMEGEVTGALEHPGIVPVYALGIDASARPFYAMRFVRGKSMGAAIKQLHRRGGGQLLRHNSMALRRLLQRFVAVCQAVEYAHSRGVIHRDLKPDNVMLGKYGETYVVDWGMARVEGRSLQGGEDSDEQVVQPGHLSGSGSKTQMGSAMGTPAFMGPEQALGHLHRLGPAADIFSLGATLYALLANRPPYTGSKVREVLEKAQLVRYPPLRKVQPAAPAALAAICRKAMSESPEDRYASAKGLAQDVERWLADEPVSAHRESLTHRLFRMARRHRAWVLAGGLALILVATTATLATIRVNRERRIAINLASQNASLAAAEATARATAETEFLAARETVDVWLTGFSEAMRHYPGVSEFRRQMLERAAAQYEAFANRRDDGEVYRLERARTQIRLGDLRRALGEPRAAVAAYEQSLSTCQSLLESPTRLSAELAAQVKLAQGRAYDRLGLASWDQGQATDARAAYEQALQTLDSISVQDFAADQTMSQRHVETWAAASINASNLALLTGDLPHAELQIAATIDPLRQAVATWPEATPIRSLLATALTSYGEVALRQGAARVAVERMQEAIALSADAVSQHPDDPQWRRQCAESRLHLATAYRQLGAHHAEAETYQLACDDYQQLIDAQPDALTYRENAARMRIDHGQLLLEIGQPRQAAVAMAAARDAIAPLVQQFPQLPRLREAYCVAIDNLAHALTVCGELATAKVEAEMAALGFAQLVEAFPAEDNYRQRQAVNSSHLAQIQFLSGEHQLASQRFELAANQIDSVLGRPQTPVASHWIAALIASRRADVALANGRPELARQAARLAHQQWQAVLERSTDPRFLELAAWFYALPTPHHEQDLQRGLELARAAADQAPENARYRATLALVHTLQGDAAAALALLQPTADPAPGSDSQPAEPWSGYIRALALAVEGRLREAREARDEAQELHLNNLPGDWDLRALQALVARRLEAAEQPSPTDDSSPAAPSDSLPTTGPASSDASIGVPDAAE
jgi:serine/threonine-protein kinase